MENKNTAQVQQPQKDYYTDEKSQNMTPEPALEDKGYNPSGKLKGKKALLTGADSGIGAAAAIAFAKEGADVAILYHSTDEDAQRTVNRIQELGRKAFALKGDIGDEKFAREAVDKTADAFGGLDILVNNAAEQHEKCSITEITPAQLERTFRTNIFGMFFTVQAALGYLPQGGRIINTTSLTAYKGEPGLLDYSSTKGAIVAFTRSLAQNEEILEKGITVNAIAPGPIWTPLIPASFDEAHLAEFGADVPLGRAGQPYELAPAYVYLASGDSSYMTGQVLHINGGVVVNG